MTTFEIQTKRNGVWTSDGLGDAEFNDREDAERNLATMIELDPEWRGREYRIAPVMASSELVTRGEIARLAGVQPQTVQAWIERHADFPAPERTFGVTRVWRWGDVAAWLAIERKPGPHGPRKR